MVDIRSKILEWIIYFIAVAIETPEIDYRSPILSIYSDISNNADTQTFSVGMSHANCSEYTA